MNLFKPPTFQAITTKILYICLFTLLSLGQLQRIQFTTTVAVYLHEICIGLVIILFLSELAKQYQKILIRLRQKKFIMVFLFFFLCQTLVWQLLKLDLAALLHIVRLLLYAQLPLIVHISIQKKYFSATNFYYFLLLMCVFFAIAGIGQYLFIPDTRFLFLMGWDDHYYRLISTLFDPGYTGLLLAIGLFLLLPLRLPQSQRILKFIGYTVFMAAILLTYSRATYLSLAVVFLLEAVIQKKWVYLLVIVLMILTIPQLPRKPGESTNLARTYSISSRITNDRNSLTVLTFPELLLGSGLYHTQDQPVGGLPDHATTANNSFIFLFGSLGIVGTLLLVAALYQLSINQAFLRIPLRPVIALIAIHSLFNNSVFYIWVMVVVFVLVGSNKKAKY